MISQDAGHGYVKFTPIKGYRDEFIKRNKERIKKDDLLKLLALCYSKNGKKLSEDCSTFHRLYCSQFGSKTIGEINNIDGNYINNYKALRFLKEI